MAVQIVVFTFSRRVPPSGDFWFCEDPPPCSPQGLPSLPPCQPCARPHSALRSSPGQPGSGSVFRSAGRPAPAPLLPCSPLLHDGLGSWPPGVRGAPLRASPPCSASLAAPRGGRGSPPLSRLLVSPLLRDSALCPALADPQLPASRAACLALLLLCVTCLSLVLRDGDQAPSPRPAPHSRLCVVQVPVPVVVIASLPHQTQGVG